MRPHDPQAFGAQLALGKARRIKVQKGFGQGQQRLSPRLQQAQVIEHNMGHPILAHRQLDPAQRQGAAGQPIGQTAVQPCLDLGHDPDGHGQGAAQKLQGQRGKAKDHGQKNQPPQKPAAMTARGFGALAQGKAFAGRRHGLRRVCHGG